MWNLWEVVRHLEMRVQALERENHAIREELRETKKRFKVRKMVYHIHALHIKEMSGTLNIGVTAPIDEKEMERLILEMKQDDN
ncbi:MAG: spore germination protein GerPC [Tumebacillaceae bacterium]